jgi:hypothetical protein
LNNVERKRWSSWCILSISWQHYSASGFARIQEVVMDDSTCRSRNSDHNLLWMRLRFGEVFWYFTSVQPLRGTSSVVV